MAVYTENSPDQIWCTFAEKLPHRRAHSMYRVLTLVHGPMNSTNAVSRSRKAYITICTITVQLIYMSLPTITNLKLLLQLSRRDCSCRHTVCQTKKKCSKFRFPSILHKKIFGIMFCFVF